jgi:hypothetical protein
MPKGKQCNNCGQVNSVIETACIYCKSENSLKNSETKDYLNSAFKLKKGAYQPHKAKEKRTYPIDSPDYHIPEEIILDTYQSKIIDIKIPFWSMVVFMVKASIASIPAFIILFVISSIALSLMGLSLNLI